MVSCCNATQGHAFKHVCCGCVDEAEEALYVADAEIRRIKFTPTPRWRTIKLRGKYVQFETLANIILDNAGNKDQSSVAGNSEVRCARDEQTTLPAEPATGIHPGNVRKGRWRHHQSDTAEATEVHSVLEKTKL